MDISTIAATIGSIAGISMVLGYIPQAVKTIRTRSTEDIAPTTFLLMGIGGLLFAIQGALLENYPLLITNSLTTILSSVIFGIKVYNDIKNKKKKK